MARTVRDSNLETRTARQRLKMRHEPYWRSISQGQHVGYRKGARGGSWIARMYLDGGYLKSVLGRADDVADADGRATLDFKQAQENARRWFTRESRKAAGLDPETGEPPKPEAAAPYTVRDAMRDYLAWYAGRGKALKATEAATNAHILPVLGDQAVASLTTVSIRQWHEKLASALRRARAGKGRGVRERKAVEGDEARRRRRATANRVLTVLKASLNHAWRDGKAPTDDAWRRVKPFHDVDAPVVRYLREAECVRLVNATETAFRPMVRAAMLTGCRYGELAALRVSDFNPDAGTLTVRTSKSGKPRHVVLADEGQRFFAEITAGRTGTELMFTRPEGGPWGKSHQQRPLLEACKRAKISPAVSFHVLRHTHGSQLAMKGVPLAVIARQLGHADTRMTERHYAHLAPSYVADTIRANFPTLGIIGKSKVRALRAK